MSADPYAPNYDTPPVPARTSSGSGSLIDRRYVKGWQGLLMALEAVFCLIAFICVAATRYYCNIGILGTMATRNYFLFVTMGAFVTTLILYVLLLFKLQTRLCCFWPVVEIIYFAILLIMFFFGVLFLSIVACTGAWKAGAAFAWFAFFTFLVDAAFSLRRLLQARGTSHTTTTTTTTATTAATTTDMRY